MKVQYDEHTDTLSIQFKMDSAIAESDEGNPGVILDYNASGEIISMEILDASRHVSETKKIEFQTA
jgi:uncharacterized protein YuzE